MRYRVSLYDIVFYLLMAVSFLLSTYILGGYYHLAGIVVSFIGVSCALTLGNAKGYSKVWAVLSGLAGLGVIIWTISSLLNSSFLFEDIVAILIGSIFYIIIILAFNYLAGRNAYYIQMLSVVIFIGAPLYTKPEFIDYRILAFSYLFLWIVLLRLNIKTDSKKKLSFSGLILVLCFLFFLIVGFFANFFVQKVVLPKARYKNAFLKTKKFDTPQTLIKMKEELSEEGLDIKVKSVDQKGNLVYHLSSIISESPVALDMEESRMKLKSIFGDLAEEGDSRGQRSKAKKLISSLENYVDTKIKERNMKSKNEFMKKVMNDNSLNLLEKLKAFMELNKALDGEKDLTGVEKDYLAKIAQGREKGKKDLKKSFEDLDEWKSYSTYRNSMKKLENYLDDLKEEKKSQGESTESKKNKAMESVQRQKEDLGRGLRELKDKVEQSGLDGYVKEDLKEKIEQINRASQQSSEELSREIERAESDSELRRVGDIVERRRELLRDKLAGLERAAEREFQGSGGDGEVSKKAEEIREKIKRNAEEISSILKEDSNDPIVRRYKAMEKASKGKRDIESKLRELREEIEKSGADSRAKRELKGKIAEIENLSEKSTKELKRRISEADNESGLSKAGDAAEKNKQVLVQKLQELEEAAEEGLVDKRLEGGIQEQIKKADEDTEKTFEELIRVLRGEGGEAEAGKKIREVFEDIKENYDSENLNEVYKKIKGEGEEAEEDLNKMLESKMNLISSRMSNEMDKKIKKADYFDKEVLKIVKDMFISKDAQQLKRKAEKLQEKLKNRMQVPKSLKQKEVKKNLSGKMKFMREKEVQRAKEFLDKGILSEKEKKQTSKELSELKAGEKGISAIEKKLKGKIKKLVEKGLVSEKYKEEILDKIEDAADIAKAREVFNGVFKEKDIDKPADIAEKWAKAVDSEIEGREELKKKLKELGRRLANAAYEDEVEMLKEEIKKTLEDLAKEEEASIDDAFKQKVSDKVRDIKQTADRRIEQISDEVQGSLDENKKKKIVEKFEDFSAEIKEGLSGLKKEVKKTALDSDKKDSIEKDIDNMNRKVESSKDRFKERIYEAAGKKEISEIAGDFKKQGEEFENNLDDLKKDINQSVEESKVKIKFSRSIDELKDSIKSNTEDISRRIKEFSNSYDSFLNKMEVSENLSDFREDIYKQIDNLQKEVRKSFADEQLKKKLEKALEKFKEKFQEDLKEIKENLEEATSNSQIKELVKKLENTKQSLNREIEKLKKEAGVKQAVEKLKKSLDDMAELKSKTLISKDLISIMESLKELSKRTESKEQKEKIEDLMEKVEQRYLEGKRIDKDTSKEVEKLADEVLVKSQEELSLDKEEKEEEVLPDWNFIVFPKTVVIAEDETVRINSMGIHQGFFVKEITNEIHWKAQDDSIAEVDKKGIIYGISPGETEVYAIYNETRQKIKVIVADRL